MSDKNIDLMRKLIEAKKKNAAPQGPTAKPQKNIGSSHKAFKNKKQGGLFDK